MSRLKHILRCVFQNTPEIEKMKSVVQVRKIIIPDKTLLFVDFCSKLDHFRDFLLTRYCFNTPFFSLISKKNKKTKSSIFIAKTEKSS